MTKSGRNKPRSSIEHRRKSPPKRRPYSKMKAPSSDPWKRLLEEGVKRHGKRQLAKRGAKRAVRSLVRRPF